MHRYAHFWQSGTWRSEFPVFPELRVTTNRRSRVASLRQAAATGLQDVAARGIWGMDQVLQVAVAWEPAFLADPMGSVWTPVLGDANRHQGLLNGPLSARTKKTEVSQR